MTSEFPTRLADLSLNDTNSNPSLYDSLKSIRKSTLSIPNRLKSILEDAKFAKEVSRHYNLPLVANERCGSWYVEPADKVASAYFKSTDGHHGHWDFSSRRLNLQLLSILGSHGGAVVVDSTRRGKSLPDAFSKTIPIWTAVINRALFPEMVSMHGLQYPPPPATLGFSEICQIEARLGGFTRAFLDLELDLQSLRSQLRRPILLSWAIRGHFRASDDENGTIPEHSHHRLVLCSASRRVRGSEVSEGGYIQGAGDDSEGWSYGLTAQLFWANKDLLMRSLEDELPTVIEGLVEREGKGCSSSRISRILPTTNVHISVGCLDRENGVDLIINCEGDPRNSAPNVVNLGCRSGKLGSKDLREKLPSAVSAVVKKLSMNPNSQIVTTCTSGKDFSVGVAVAILCLLFDDQGEPVPLLV